MLRLVPMTVKAAERHVREKHRHHKPPRGAMWSVGVKSDAGEVVGVAMVGRPLARRIAEIEGVAEITRVATDGTFNACSKLYGACKRAARALGYRWLVTYTLESEPGTSLIAAGFWGEPNHGGGSWSRDDRPRSDPNPTCAKWRWICWVGDE